MEKLIIFDVDGVLEKENTIKKKRTEHLMRAISSRFDISVSEAKNLYDKTKNLMPKSKNITTAHIMSKIGFSRKEFFKLIDEVDPESIISTNKNCIELLKVLKKNDFEMVTYSNTPRKTTLKTLDLLKIRKYFSEIFSSEDFKESKPSENNLKCILKKMRVNPNDTVVIGNSIEKDLIPAHNLGIKTILYDPKKEYNKKKSADFIVRDLLEIVDIV